MVNRMQDIKRVNVNTELDKVIEKALSDTEISCFNKTGLALFPGFCDVHVHFREPGFFYKETIKTGSQSASRGGYTTVLTMPNTNPTPDSMENLKIQLDIIKSDAVINVIPYGTITMGEMGKELSKMDEMEDYVVAFSDDGRGVQNDDIMREAMTKAKQLDKIIAAHCEVNSLLNGGYIHDGEYAKEHIHKGICSKSEWLQIKRDIELVKEIGCKYHVCHISCKESVDIIRKAKKDGIDITCETAPHYLLLDESDLQEDGRFKMNPPIRSLEDRLALIEGIKDGTIDMIATDHAPHSPEEKSRGLEKSPFGIVGLEVAFPLLYTELVKKDVISIEKLTELLSTNPKKRFKIDDKDGFSLWDLNSNYEIDTKNFLSKGKSTPFEGKTVFGECVLTYSRGKVVYKR